MPDDELYEVLIKLTPDQLDHVIRVSGVSREHLPPRSTSVSHRAGNLVDLARSNPKLLSALRKALRDLHKSAPEPSRTATSPTQNRAGGRGRILRGAAIFVILVAIGGLIIAIERIFGPESPEPTPSLQASLDITEEIIPTETATEEPVTPTETPTPTVTPPPDKPAPTLVMTPVSRIYDDFEDFCLSEYKWYSSIDSPPPYIEGDCLVFGSSDELRNFVEAGGELRLTAVEDAYEGIISFWPECQVKEIQLVLSDFRFDGLGHGFFGVVVPHPEGGTKPIGIWISARHKLTHLDTEVITTREWDGSQTLMSAEVLLDELPDSDELILALSFSGLEAQAAVGGHELTRSEPIAALGYPGYFMIYYRVVPGSELSANVEEVRVEPAALITECRLPTVTPTP